MSRIRPRPTTQRWLQRLLWAGCGIFAAFLGVLVFLGTTSRFLQDDYCFSVILSQKSLVDIYLNETTFSGNRFMLVLTTSFSERLGTWSVQALPGFLLVMWVIGLTLTLRQVYYVVGGSRKNQSGFIAEHRLAAARCWWRKSSCFSACMLRPIVFRCFIGGPGL